MSAGFLLTRISKKSSSSENCNSVRAARSCVPCLGPAYHFAILTAGDRFLAFMSAGFLPSRISKRSSSSETATSVCAARSCVSCLGPAYHFVNPTAGDRFLAFMSAGFLPSRISKKIISIRKLHFRPRRQILRPLPRSCVSLCQSRQSKTSICETFF